MRRGRCMHVGLRAAHVPQGAPAGVPAGPGPAMEPPSVGRPNTRGKTHATTGRRNAGFVGPTRTPGDARLRRCHGAHLIEEAGFKVAFASGSSISAMRLAMPDMDLLTFPEMRDAV